jgi:hypothetical protein
MATNSKDVPRHYYSLNEYFALEQAGDARFEYWDGDIICMSGGSRAWERRDVTDMDASIELESVGSALKMRDIYDGLTFPA